MFKTIYASEKAEKRCIEFSNRKEYKHCTRSFSTWFSDEDTYLLQNFTSNTIEHLSQVHKRSHNAIIIRYEQLRKKQFKMDQKMNTSQYKSVPKKGYIVVKKSVLSESYTFTEKPFIHDTQAEAIKEAQRLLQKTLAMGETNCEFQVLKIDKIVRPVVISPIEIV